MTDAVNLHLAGSGQSFRFDEALDSLAFQPMHKSCNKSGGLIGRRILGHKQVERLHIDVMHMRATAVSTAVR